MPRRIAVMTTSLLVALSASAAHAASSHPCAADATSRAAKLLALHTQGDDRAAVDARSVRTISPIRNPANSKQTFDVLSVTGYVYKAEYRMRFLYAQISGQCALVGQEILEFTGL